MRVTLQKGATSRRIENFDPASVKWRRQASEFAIGVPTGLADPAQMFVKRGPQATGHLLWVKAATKQIALPATPEPYGYARDGTGHYYFSESLPKSHTTLESLLTKTPMGDRVAAQAWLKKLLIERNIGEATALASANLLAALDKQQFVFADFSTKNFMVDRMTHAVSLIDLDSCLGWRELPKNLDELRGYGTKFSLTYWYAWHAGMGTFQPQSLGQTMVMSFCAIWARGLAMIRTGRDPVEVVKLLRNPVSDNQAPFWTALQNDDLQAFQRHFCLFATPELDTLWERWVAVFAELRGGRRVPWPQIRALVSHTFETVRSGDVIVAPPPPPPSPPPPVSQPVERLSRGAYAWQAVLALCLIVGAFIFDMANLRFPLTLFFPTIFWWWISLRRAHDYGSNGVLFSVVSLIFMGCYIVLISTRTLNNLTAILGLGLVVSFVVMIIGTIVNCAKPST